jgi:hypothetical protein
MRPRRHRLPTRVAQGFDESRHRILLSPGQSTSPTRVCRLRSSNRHQDSVDKLLHLAQIAGSLSLIKLKPFDQIIPMNWFTTPSRDSAVDDQPRHRFNSAIDICFAFGKRDLSFTQRGFA